MGGGSSHRKPELMKLAVCMIDVALKSLPTPEKNTQATTVL